VYPMCRAMRSARASLRPITTRSTSANRVRRRTSTRWSPCSPPGVWISSSLDGVTPGSYNDDLTIDNRADVQAWSTAIAHSGRPIWLTVSWALNADYLSTWQLANARRIDEDIECEGRCATLTDWPMVTERFYDLVAWEKRPQAGPWVGMIWTRWT